MDSYSFTRIFSDSHEVIWMNSLTQSSLGRCLEFRGLPWCPPFFEVVEMEHDHFWTGDRIGSSPQVFNTKKWKPWPVEVDDLPLEHEKTGRFSKANC